VPSAPGIGGGAATTGSKRRLHRALRHEVTVWCARGQGGSGGMRRWHWLWRSCGRRQRTREGDWGEKSPTGGAHTGGGWLIGGAVRASGPTSRGTRRVGQHGPASCGGWGQHVEFGARRRNSFSFSKEFSNYSGVKINPGKILGCLRKL
jgi:hypothetical protein